MFSHDLFSFIFIVFAIHSSSVQVSARLNSLDSPSLRSSPFSIGLEILQKQIDYKFNKTDLLRRAMTHASYSEENNKALSILGEKVIQTYVALESLKEDIDISSKDLNNKISDISLVEKSCAVDGLRLELQNVLRVSKKTDPATPAVVCGAFRAIFGAIAIDKGKSDDAGEVFWKVHGGGIGRAIAL